VYFVWVSLISTLVFKSCTYQTDPIFFFFSLPFVLRGWSPAAAGILPSPLAVTARWLLLPRSCPTLPIWERKDGRWMERLHRHLVCCRAVNGNLPTQRPSECVPCSCLLAERRLSTFLHLGACGGPWYVMQFTAEQKVAKSGKRGKNGQPNILPNIEGLVMSL